MKPIKLAFFLAVFPLLAFVPSASRIEVVGVRMESKTLEKGYYYKLSANIYYRAAEGKMLTHVTYPDELVTMTNKVGEIKIYNPKDNTVAVQRDANFSTKENWLYYFLSMGSNDMGLEIRGFALYDTRFEDGLMITQWLPPPSLKNVLSKVELVHRDFKPLYIGYEKPEGGFLRKVYFTKYQPLENMNLPQKITEILFFDGKDSVITTTTFSEIQLNEKVSGQYSNFTIPLNATSAE